MTDFHGSAYQLARLLLASLVEIHHSEGINSHSAGDLRRAEEPEQLGEIYAKRPGQCGDSDRSITSSGTDYAIPGKVDPAGGSARRRRTSSAHTVRSSAQQSADE